MPPARPPMALLPAKAGAANAGMTNAELQGNGSQITSQPSRRQGSLLPSLHQLHV